MRIVDIRTPQNVVVSFEAANIFDRYMATFLDLIFQALIIILLSLSLSFFQAGEMVYYFFIFIPISFYHLFSELIMNGQSWGKKIMGLQVINIYGKNPTAMDYISRWVFRGLEVMSSFGAIAAVFINSSDKGQRIGDFVANTTVIKLRPKNKISFEEVNKISDAEVYTPKYTEVKELKEIDLIHIKTLLQRHQKYPNDTHKNLISSTVKHICEVLDIQNQEATEIQFLKTLIKDYIVLTR